MPQLQLDGIIEGTVAIRVYLNGVRKPLRPDVVRLDVRIRVVAGELDPAVFYGGANIEKLASSGGDHFLEVVRRVTEALESEIRLLREENPNFGSSSNHRNGKTRP